MQTLHKALGLIGIRAGEKGNGRPNYQQLMREALDRVATAERMLREAGSLEQLDLARSAHQSAQAEVQQVIRAAKRERGIALRPIAETEELHRKLRDLMHGQKSQERPSRRRGGTGRAG
ncbi:MAG: hypothetical protein ACOY94_01000 [Bacillota bacterium]